MFIWRKPAILLMVLCPACGKEMPMDKKFCEECGAALPQREILPGTSERSAAPLSPQDKSGQDTKKSRRAMIKLIAGGTGALVFLILVLFVLPFLSGSQQPSAGSAAVPAVTRVPVASPSPAASVAEVAIAQPTAGIEVYDERTGSTYLQVYRNQQDFSTGQTVTFPYTVKTPPLLIRFTLTPQMIVHDKIINHGLSTERTVTENIPDPLSFFEIDVIDTSTGTVVDRQGFNKNFGTETEQEFMVRSARDFRIEMTGNRVNADVQILTGKP
jgi:predicted nucleic acid-binding Zn ribbon protein